MFGSGEGPMVYRVFIETESILSYQKYDHLKPMPPNDSVAQIGSPENNSSYSGST